MRDIVTEVKEGDVFRSRVKEIKDFGAVVQILRQREGLLHISQLRTHALQTLKVGQILNVKCIGVDRVGGYVKLALSIPRVR